MSRSLIFIKHSMPAREPGVPSREWRLSDVGRARCLPRAERFTVYQPVVVAARTSSVVVIVANSLCRFISVMAWMVSAA